MTGRCRRATTRSACVPCMTRRRAASPSASRHRRSSRSTAYHDAFGNWVHQFNILPNHSQLRIQAESVVLAHDVPPIESSMTLAELDAQREEIYEDYYDFVAPTTYVPHLSQLADLSEAAEDCGDATVQGFARAASDLIHERFRYVKGATHVHSSIADSLADGRRRLPGFCSSLAGGCARPRAARALCFGLPGPQRERGSHQPGAGDWRSGYACLGGGLHSRRGLDAAGSHAGNSVGMRHVRVAYGRDYGDVAPVRGVYNGHAGQRLSVDVLARPALDDYGNEQLVETAGPADAPLPDERAHQPAQQQ